MVTECAVTGSKSVQQSCSAKNVTTVTYNSLDCSGSVNSTVVTSNVEDRCSFQMMYNCGTLTYTTPNTVVAIRYATDNCSGPVQQRFVYYPSTTCLVLGSSSALYKRNATHFGGTVVQILLLLDHAVQEWSFHWFPVLSIRILLNPLKHALLVQQTPAMMVSPQVAKHAPAQVALPVRLPLE